MVQDSHRSPLSPKEYDLSTEEGYTNAVVATWVEEGVYSSSSNLKSSNLTLQSNGVWNGTRSYELAEKRTFGYIGYEGYWYVKSSGGGYYIHIDAAGLDNGIFEGDYYINKSNPNVIQSSDGQHVYRRTAAA